MKISPARRAAFEVLNRIDDDQAFSSVLLPQYELELSPSDRGLCHELVLGVLRRRIYLDRMIEHYAGSKKMDTAVRNALRIGLYQIAMLDKIPVHAAINESVNMVQAAKKTSAKGLVNAVLRRLSEKLPDLSFSDHVDQISVETSHPRWLVEKWISDFGDVEAEAIAKANNDQPRTTFRATAKTHVNLSGYRNGEIVESSYVADSIDGDLRQLAEDGEIYIQDEASQLVASIVTSGLVGRFLDVCAAPGGKTTQVVRQAETLVVAGDLHESRVRLLKATCERQGADAVGILRYDAERALPFADEAFDTILVDAPCSGTGTIRHNPEIRYSLEQTDFGTLANKQRSILENASKLVRRGGRLIYSTCSIQFEENEHVCNAFLQESAYFKLVRPDVPIRLLTEAGYARTFPHRDGTDGFFVAVLERS